MIAEKQKENFEDTPITTEELARMTSVGFADTQRQINNLSEDIAAVSAKVDHLEERFDGLEKRFDGLEKRFDGLESRFNGFENKLDTIIENMVTKEDMRKLSARVTKLELQAE